MQTEHLSYDSVCHLDRSGQYQKIKYELTHIAPYHGYRRCIFSDHRRACCKYTEDDTRQYDNCAL